jgi:hypothetical protein
MEWNGKESACVCVCVFRKKRKKKTFLSLLHSKDLVGICKLKKKGLTDRIVVVV